MGLRVGVDTGGTFTDIAIFDGRGIGGIEVLKIPSTPHDPSEAIGLGLEQAVGARPVDAVVHGTTVATNVLLEGRGTRVALLVTEGFRDVLEIARQERPSLYDFTAMRPAPLVPRRLRLEVSERMSHTGVALVSPDPQQVRDLAQHILGLGIESVVVCFLHSYANPQHERLVREIFGAVAPEVAISLSSDLVAEFKEYERMSTVVINGYVKPAVHDYLLRLTERLQRYPGASLQVMKSSGGVADAAQIAEAPVHTVLSGPAAGALAGTETGVLAGFEDVLSVDMGGTSFDISVAVDGRLSWTTESEIAKRVIKIPMIEIHTLGAGGGSVAWVDSGGGLQVGPRSAGALPGPACYGRGGIEPTVTDANVVLGRIGGDGLAAGGLTLDVDAAHRVVSDAVAGPLGLSVTEAAEGIVRVVNAIMVKGIRSVSVERGLDPRRFAMVAFGGSGPLHAAELARELGVRAAVIPLHPGLHSACGLLLADVRQDYVQTFRSPVNTGGMEQMEDIFEELVSNATSTLAEDGLTGSRIVLSRFADIRYIGQGFELSVPLGRHPLGAKDVEPTISAFHDAHARRYGFSKTDEPVEVVNVRLVAVGLIEKGSREVGSINGKDASAAQTGERRVVFDGHAAATSIYDRALLKSGNTLTGPALITQLDSTTVVPPHHTGRVDSHLHVVVEPSRSAARPA